MIDLNEYLIGHSEHVTSDQRLLLWNLLWWHDHNKIIQCAPGFCQLRKWGNSRRQMVFDDLGMKFIPQCITTKFLEIPECHWRNWMINWAHQSVHLGQNTSVCDLWQWWIDRWIFEEERRERETKGEIPLGGNHYILHINRFIINTDK